MQKIIYGCTGYILAGAKTGCAAGGLNCYDKESIEGGTWQEVDSENDEGEGKEILNRDKSYMICTKHEGVIYFYDDGQEIKECLEEQKTAFSEWAKENRSDKVQFLEPFLQVSMAEQLRTGVPWQVTLAQIAYESGWGQKEMYDEYTKKQSFNLFGIKYFGNTEDNDKYVRSWTTEYISSSELDKWEKEQKRWALNGEKLINMGVSENNKIKIKVIQPFRRYESYKESIVDHSDILLDERYAEAWEYKDNPFIYVSIIGPGSDYGDTAASIMHDYFMWDDEEKDWEEYILWREGK